MTLQYNISVFKSLLSIDRYPMNMNILALNVRALQMGRNEKNDDFLENGSNDYD
jgi:hypothetical protein